MDIKLRLARLVFLLALAALIVSSCSKSVDPQEKAAEYAVLPAHMQAMDATALREHVDSSVAELLTQGGNWWETRVEVDQASELYASAIELDDHQLAARSAYWLGKRLHYDDQETGVVLLEAAIDDASANGLKEEEAFLHIALSECLVFAGLELRAAKEAEKADSEFKGLGHLEGRKLALMAIGRAYHKTGRFRKIAEAFDTSVDILRDLGDSGDKLLPRLALAGFAKMDAGLKHEGLARFETALAESRESSEPRDLLRCLNLLAFNQLEYGMFDSAEQNCLEALELPCRFDRAIDALEPYQTLFQVYRSTRQPEMAYAALDQATADFDSITAQSSQKERSDFDASQLISEMAALLVMAGDYKLEQGSPDAALSYFQQAESATNNLAWSAPVIDRDYGIIEAQTELGNVDAAQARLDALASAGYLDPEYLGADPRFKLAQAKVHAAGKHNRKAEKALKKILADAEEAGIFASRIEKADAMMELARLYASMKKGKQAQDTYSEAFSVLVDEARNVHWKSALMHGLYDDISNCAREWQQSTGQSENSKVDNQLEIAINSVNRLQEFVNSQAEIEESAVDPLLLEYRTKLSEKESLRSTWRWLTGGVYDEKEVWRIIRQRPNSSLHEEMFQNYLTVRDEINGKIELLDAQCNELLTRISKDDPELFGLITLATD